VAGIAGDITKLVGNTPLVYLNKLTKGLNGKIAVKLESFNPMSSVKDRIALSMVETAERDGKLRPGGTIIEPTSGNTGIGLSMVAAARGYRAVMVMPDTMSVERRKIMATLGAEIVLTPGDKGMKGAIEKAREILESTPNSFMPMQFDNPANPDAHRRTTAEEIWRDTEGRIDCFIAGVGTGGTLTGVSEVLKERKPGFKAIAVEPEGSPVISGGKPGKHKIQGIGAGFVPHVLNTEIIDEVILVKNEDAAETMKRLSREEGIFGGISAGANVWAALQVAARPESEGKLIVTVICDTGERYLSTWALKDVQAG
jgi:cysteine synthase A